MPAIVIKIVVCDLTTMLTDPMLPSTLLGLFTCWTTSSIVGVEVLLAIAVGILAYFVLSSSMNGIAITILALKECYECKFAIARGLYHQSYLLCSNIFKFI